VKSETDALLISFHTHVILRNCRFCVNIFHHCIKIVGDDDETSVTSPWLKVIKFYAIGKFSKFRKQY